MNIDEVSLLAQVNKHTNALPGSQDEVSLFAKVSKLCTSCESKMDTNEVLLAND